MSGKTPSAQNQDLANADSTPPEEDFQNPFSFRRPKNAVAGISSGFKNLSKGVLTGAAAMVYAPYVGAKEDGLKGFAKGLGTGIVGGIGLAAVGAASGVVQVSRGIINQAEAFQNEGQDKIWDATKREWKIYSLKEEINEYENISEEDYLAKNW